MYIFFAIVVQSCAHVCTFFDDSPYIYSYHISAGGRAAPRRMSAPPVQRTTINRTTVVAPPVVMGGGYGYRGYGYGYDPTPGLVFGAVNAIGNGMRESRQNQMIMDERAQLSASQEREAEMAARIRQLEMQQQGQQVGQPQVIIAQPQAAPAPAN